MDPINLIFGIVFFVVMTGNFTKASLILKQNKHKIELRPTTFLQKLPLNVAAIIVLLQLLGIFEVGQFTVLNYDLTLIRMFMLLAFSIISWLQFSIIKEQGDFYTTDIIIFKDHELNCEGIYNYIRHPQYLFQLLADLLAGFILLNSFVLIAVIFLEIPLFIMRAKFEEKLLEKKFGNLELDYKKSSSFFIPTLK